MRACVVMGTRPEAIKLAPLVLQLRRQGVPVEVVNTGQHRELIAPVLDLFDIRPDVDLDVMRKAQSLSTLTARLVEETGKVFAQRSYSHVFVQGDTTTAFSAGLSAFYSRLWIGHVEAGLRTNDLASPFPEEANRRFVSVIADRHYAPTARAAENLLAEGVGADRILVTGNTVVDALRWVQEHRLGEMDDDLRYMGLAERPFVLATLHRRENIGIHFDSIVGALSRFLSNRPDWLLVLPLHKNPSVRTQILAHLGGNPQAMLIEAQGYQEFCALMRSCQFIVTDSGGIQEEAPYLNKRTLVVRNTTERPEAVAAGTSWLVGTDPIRIATALEETAQDVQAERVVGLREANPFGDGTATEQIVSDLRSRAGT